MYASNYSSVCGIVDGVFRYKCDTILSWARRESGKVNSAQFVLICFLSVVLSASIASMIYSTIKCILSGGKRSLPPIFHGKRSYLPFGIGGFLDFAKAPLDAIRNGRTALGDCFTINMLGKRMTFMVGTEAHEVFFRATDDELSQEEVYKFMIPVFGKGVVYDAAPHIRRQQFRFLGTGLRGRRLKSYVPLLVNEVRAFFERTMPGEKGEVDILDKLSELTILTASRCLMGKEVREQLFDEVAHLFHTLDKGITPLSVFWPHAPVPSHWNRDRARRDMVRLLGKVIRKKRSEIEADPSGDHGEDMLAYLAQVKYKDGRALTDHEIVGFFIALLFAGQHTSSITATWTVLNIAHNRDVLKRVVREQSDALLSGDVKSVDDAFKNLDYGTVGKMELAGLCVKESLRMFPPLILLLRHVRKTRSFRGFTIPEGDTLVTSPGAAMRMDDVFDRPDVFDPDRWNDSRPTGKSNVSNESDDGGERKRRKKVFDFIGFGGGMHACAGTQFAYLQIRVILTVLFQTYDIEPVTNRLPRPDYTAMVVGPLKGKETRVRYRRRHRTDVDVPTKEMGDPAEKLSPRPAIRKDNDGVARKHNRSTDQGSALSRLPTFAMEDVRTHNRLDDAWLVIDGLVYDVTKYVKTHPGGESVLAKAAGGDASVGFGGPQHPPHARTTLEQFLIGRVSSEKQTPESGSRLGVA